MSTGGRKRRGGNGSEGTGNPSIKGPKAPAAPQTPEKPAKPPTSIPGGPKSPDTPPKGAQGGRRKKRGGDEFDEPPSSTFQPDDEEDFEPDLNEQVDVTDEEAKKLGIYDKAYYDMWKGKKYYYKTAVEKAKRALSNLSEPAAGPGGRRITRRAHWRYIRGMKIRFPARKVRDMGARGKWSAKHGPGIGKLEEGGLMGYSPSQSKTMRHRKLSKVVKRKGALTTFRKLNALSTYTKRTAKSKSRTARADRNWVKKTYMK